MKGKFKQLRDNFEAQFEPSSDGSYLYRRNQHGEPIPVSAVERDRFIDQFVRRVRLMMVLMIVGLLAFITFVVWRSIEIGHDLPKIVLYSGTAAITAVSIVGLYRVRSAPSRELEGRASIGRERSREEMRAIYFSKLSYGQLASAAAFGVIFVLSRATDEDGLTGWNRLWLVLGVTIVLMTAVQALRKWRFEHNA